MCGINGCVSNTQDDVFSVEDTLRKMNGSILHRGPDDDGFFIDKKPNSIIGMAMRRLSVIDLRQGKQPFYTEDKSKVIVFNGEIYNFQSLRNELEQKGIPFKTKSDTEVVLKLYEVYGVSSFAMLDGMFGFSIYDKTIDKVFIARDFFGEKPLYYTENNNRFIWASELKSIVKVLPSKPSINATGLNLFMQLTYIPAPYSIYENIYKLEANHYLELDYANLSYNIREIEQDFRMYSETTKAKAIETTHDLVSKSVISRSIADVPLGTFLSGGVDSSIISLSLAQQSSTKIDTFSIGFDKKDFDETDKSRVVAKLINSNHNEFIISEKDLIPNINEVLLNFDEPFADSSALASYIVANETKQYVTVALTGDGGDEVFGGYNKYYMGKLNEKYTNHVPLFIHKRLSEALSTLLHVKDDNRGIRFKIIRLLKAIDYKDDFYFKIISLGFQESEMKSFLQANIYKEESLSYFKDKVGNRNKTLTDFRDIDKLLSLEGDMLVKVDRTSMLSSLECRAPFLNKEIWNFTRQLPENYLLSGWDKKHILKESFKHYFPSGFLNKSKKGFEVPVGDWLRADLSKELSSYIDKDFIEKQNIFQFKVVSDLVENHIQGKIDNTFRVWTFYCFQKWYKLTYCELNMLIIT